MTMAQVVHLSKPMDDKRVTKKQFRVARGYTVVDEESRTLFINYDDGFLFNFSKETDVCRRFTISSSDNKDDFVAGQIKIFSELTFLEEGHHKGKKNQRYPKYTVINAPRAMLHRWVTEARFEQFGIIFTPGASRYRIDRSHGDFNTLLETAQHNIATAGVINPLLIQLDVTLLLSRFGGVPVYKTGKEKTTELLFSIEKKHRLHELLPPQCAGI